MAIDKDSKVCCNCRHCIRIKDVESGYVWCRCDTKDAFLSYAQVMAGWCRRWAKDREERREEE